MFQRIVILISSISLFACSSMVPLGCSENWQITGYYTPLEAEFIGSQENIQITNGTKNSFKTDFLTAVKIEGWGQTLEGWYLGYYSSSWHRSQFPKDAKGQALRIGIAAGDQAYLNPGNKIIIKDMVKTLGISQFKVSDVGSAIKGRHIDIYTGEGESAKQKTWLITGLHQVCAI